MNPVFLFMVVVCVIVAISSPIWWLNLMSLIAAGFYLEMSLDI